MSRALAVTFTDLPNVTYLIPYTHHGVAVIDLKFEVTHPRTREKVMVYYRRTSTSGKGIYFYSEGTRAGEVLGG
jgi:hypothetical protein